MKLTILALALCSVAFAAPRSNFLESDQLIPEELVEVGVSSNVATLKREFHELQMQLKSGAEVTPGVKDTIDKMISMVTERIEPAINQAHADDQDILNDRMEEIKQLNDGLNDDVKLLNDQADVVRGLIVKEQKAAAAWDSAAALFTSTQNDYLVTYDNKTDTCCQSQNSAVIDVEYVPAFVECDYTVPAGATCSKRARQAVAGIVTTPFTDGLALYRRLLGACSGLTEDLDAADKDTTVKINDCQAKKRAEKAASDLASTEQARVQKEWDMTIETYNVNYTSHNAGYQHAKGVV